MPIKKSYRSIYPDDLPVELQLILMNRGYNSIFENNEDKQGNMASILYGYISIGELIIFCHHLF